MIDQDAWQVVSTPLPISAYKSARRRAMTLRVFCVIAAMVMVAVALWAVN